MSGNSADPKGFLDQLQKPLGSIILDMTSPSPLQCDSYYHIYNRGTNRENIFIQERNYAHFMNLYSKYIEPIADTFAYCLLKNHFHLLVRIKSTEEILENRKTLKVFLTKLPQHEQVHLASKENGQPTKPLGSLYPSKVFSAFFNAYAKAINNAYGRTGSLFQHPFGRVLIKSDKQFTRVITYIHQNPQKHGFVKDFRYWKYSSYGTILSENQTHLKRAKVLDWFGGKTGYADIHQGWINEIKSNEFAENDID